MFSLEQSIAEWRKQMLAAGIKTPVPLEELEIHLREEIERQINSGLDESKAFDSALQKFGKIGALKAELSKVDGINLKKYMNTKLKPIGTTLAFGAIIAGGLLQVFTNSFISFHHNGALAAVIFRWPVFLIIAMHFAGLVCLAWPTQRQSSDAI
jgi:hypothetical protein